MCEAKSKWSEACEEFEGCEVEDDFPYFNTPLLAIFKMFSMSMGEIEFSSIYKDAMVMEDNGLGTNFATVLVYMGFIFMILLVLMNLLNGLAISDVNRLAEMAEVESAMSRLQMIAESDALVSFLKKMLRNVRCVCHKS